MRILVIEDDDGMRELYEMAFKRLQASVFVTEYVAAALEALPCHVAVIDYQLRQSTGVEILKVLRAKQDDLPVVFATAASTSDELDIICAAGGILLRKPFTISELHEAVKAAAQK